MRDTVELEKMGVPTATFVSPAFEVAARAQCKAMGLPNLPLVIVPPARGWETSEDERRKVDKVFDTVVAFLSQATPQPAR